MNPPMLIKQERQYPAVRNGVPAMASEYTSPIYGAYIGSALHGHAPKRNFASSLPSMAIGYLGLLNGVVEV